MRVPHRTPRIRSQVGATASLEPLWAFAFPAFHLFTFGYGTYASVFYIPQLRAGTSGDPLFAHAFGIAIALASALALTGAVNTLVRRTDTLELVGTAAFTCMMVIYFLALTLLVGVVHDPGTRPGSAFIPVCMGTFPAFRWAVIIRDRRGRREVAA